MDRHLLERMVGAGVLVLALIIVVPAVLDGGRSPDPKPSEVTSGRSAESGQTQRTHTIRLDRQPEQPPVARALPAPTAAENQRREPDVPDTMPPPVVAKAEPAAKPAAPNPEPRPTPKPEPKPAVEAKPAPAPEPVPKLDPASLPKPAAGPAMKSGWAVQLGAFSQRDYAKRLEQEVKGKGFATYVVTHKRADSTLYRVRVGPAETRSQADALAGKLAAAGYKGQVIAQKPGS